MEDKTKEKNGQQAPSEIQISKTLATHKPRQGDEEDESFDEEKDRKDGWVIYHTII